MTKRRVAMERMTPVLQRPTGGDCRSNCFSISLYSAQKPGDLAFIRVSYYPVTMFSQVRTLPRGSSEAQYELDVVPRRSEPLYPDRLSAAARRAAAAGCHSGWRQLRRCDSTKIELTDADTSPGAARCCAERWQAIRVPSGKYTICAATVLRIMLKKSDNMIADTVFPHQ